jgi:hypothetical protein
MCMVSLISLCVSVQSEEVNNFDIRVLLVPLGAQYS